MWRGLLGIIGLMIVGLTVADALWVTVSVGRSGNLSVARGLSRAAWRALHWSPRASHRRLRTAAGTVIVTAVIVGWAVGIWVGWSLVFCSSEWAVVDSTSHAPVGAWARIYFAGSSAVTLGLGDYRPGTPLFQAAAVAAALNGLFVITLAITYAGQVLGAVIQKQALAGSIAALGETAGQIITGAWNGRDFGRLGDHLMALVPTLVLVSRQYLAYPVLHYFHSRRQAASAALAIAALREAVLLLEHGVAPGHRPGPGCMRPVRRAVDALAAAMRPSAVSEVRDPPPAPDLGLLQDAGIPTADPAEFAGDVNEQAQHRRLLAALVEWDGWAWDDLAGEPRP